MANTTFDSDRYEGFENVPWLPRLNILFVIDGRINTSKLANVFGLGYVLETLRSTSAFVRLNVEVVRRDGMPGNTGSTHDDIRYHAYGGPPRVNFTFTPDSLRGWDQVWFFADNPANLSDDHTQDQFHPLIDIELKTLAEWMDSGGGVFAVGDHWNLGASMCSRIPRVRSMRRWTVAQGVPPQDGDQRHETLQPNPSLEFSEDWEGDAIPQPVEVVQWSAAASEMSRSFFPHALLDTPDGPIRNFPDHMHEGDVIPDDQVRLDDALEFPNYDKPEYPSTADASFRPQPHVVAYGRTTNPHPLASTTALARLASGAVLDNAAFVTERFALIGAYDGDSVGIGRVVVESTWHHWFSLNLHGFASNDSTKPSAALYRPTAPAYARMSQYELMQTYYRNVAVWLATPAQRQSMLVAAVWRTIVHDTMAFPLAPPQSLWTVGERMRGAIAPVFAQSMLIDVVDSMYGNRRQISGTQKAIDAAAPQVGSIPVDLALRAMLGGITSSLIKPAYDYVFGGPRPFLDPRVIARHFADGVAQGHRAIVDTLHERASMASKLVANLEHAFKPSAPVVEVDFFKLRIVIEMLQIPDAGDPYLAGNKLRAGKPAVTLAVALRNTTVAKESRHIEIRDFEPAGALVKLELILYDGIVQDGESLVIELSAGEEGDVAVEHLRFRDVRTGNPAAWAGQHGPDRSQPWRLWYRIEIDRQAAG